MARPDGRTLDQLRPVTINRGWSMHPEGSVLIDCGDTRVLCTASVTPGVPRWRKGSGLGWVTSEYSMLPRSTTTRNDRESVKGRIGGRTHEISRLIGRSLRACIDLSALGENSIVIDCDVLQADGGTRTASITGSFVALSDAVTWMAGKRMLAAAPEKVIHRSICAVSVGVIGGEPRLDLNYTEDVSADVDMNIVCTGTGEFVEVQGTGEHNVFARAELNALLDLGVAGCAELTALQEKALASPMNVLLATRNAKKLVELQRILDAASMAVTVVGMTDVNDYVEVPESGVTFAENALLKATEGVKYTDLPTVADDSGLAVDVMGGMPGIFSARWSGKHGDDDANLDLLLAQITDLPDSARAASFICAAALALPDGRTFVAEGRMSGHLIRARRGTGGFGYDPIFVPEGMSVTSAELAPAEKDAISHRGKAFRELAGIIARELT